MSVYNSTNVQILITKKYELLGKREPFLFPHSIWHKYHDHTAHLLGCGIL